MAKISGRLLKIGVAKEASRGAGASSFPTAVPPMSFSFDDKVITARSQAGLGVLADSEENFVTTKYGAGDLEGEVRSDSIGFLLYGILGSVSTAGPTDSAYTHSFSVSNTTQGQSLALLVDDVNTKEEYPLVMLDTLELSAELDAISKVSASFMSKKGNVSTKTMPAVASEYKFTKKHLQVKVASDLASLSGASTLSIKDLTVTFSKGVVLDDALGTAEPEDILGTVLGIEGTMTLNYTDETWKNYMKNNTDRAMEIKFLNTDATIGSGTNPSLTMRFPKVDFFDWEPSYGNDEIVTQTISFKCSRDVANGSAIISTCDLVNDVVSY